jgi:hypothetical protein
MERSCAGAMAEAGVGAAEAADDAAGANAGTTVEAGIDAVGTVASPGPLIITLTIILILIGQLFLEREHSPISDLCMTPRFCFLDNRMPPLVQSLYYSEIFLDNLKSFFGARSHKLDNL